MATLFLRQLGGEGGEWCFVIRGHRNIRGFVSSVPPPADGGDRSILEVMDDLMHLCH